MGNPGSDRERGRVARAHKQKRVELNDSFGGSKRIWGPSQILVIVATLPLIVALVVFRDTIFPARFFYDGLKIQEIAQGARFHEFDTSFGMVASSYRILGLANSPLMASALGSLLVLIVSVTAAHKASQSRSPNFAATVVLALSIVLGAVFMGFFSKDVFVLLIVLGVLLIPRGIWGELVILATMLLYASEFRTYWYFVLVGYLGFSWLLSRASGLRNLISAAFAFVISAGSAIVIVMRVPADHFRSSANLERIGAPDAESMITRIIDSPEPLGGIINVALGLPMLAAPLPLLLKGGLYYSVLFVLISFVWVVFINSVRADRFLEVGQQFLFRRAVALVVSFVCTQALFEPDYGSYLRHLSPLLPLVVFVVWSATAQSRSRSALQSQHGIRSKGGSSA